MFLFSLMFLKYKWFFHPMCLAIGYGMFAKDSNVSLPLILKFNIWEILLFDLPTIPQWVSVYIFLFPFCSIT